MDLEKGHAQVRPWEDIGCRNDGDENRPNSLRDGGGQLDLSDAQHFVLAVLLIGQLEPDKEQSQPQDPTSPATLHQTFSGCFCPTCPSA